jgi:hypothetical protein
MIDDIEIKWAGSGTVQHLQKIKNNQFMEITEDGKVTPLNLKVLKFNTADRQCRCKWLICKYKRIYVKNHSAA